MGAGLEAKLLRKRHIKYMEEEWKRERNAAPSSVELRAKRMEKEWQARRDLTQPKFYQSYVDEEVL